MFSRYYRDMVDIPDADSDYDEPESITDGLALLNYEPVKRPVKKAHDETDAFGQLDKNVFIQPGTDIKFDLARLRYDSSHK
jgi:hypothetical protein